MIEKLCAEGFRLFQARHTEAQLIEDLRTSEDYDACLKKFTALSDTRKSFNVCLQMIKKYPQIYEYIPHELKWNENICNTLLTKPFNDTSDKRDYEYFHLLPDDVQFKTWCKVVTAYFSKSTLYPFSIEKDYYEYVCEGKSPAFLEKTQYEIISDICTYINPYLLIFLPYPLITPERCKVALDQMAEYLPKRTEDDLTSPVIDETMQLELRKILEAAKRCHEKALEVHAARVKQSKQSLPAPTPGETSEEAS